MKSTKSFFLEGDEREEFKRIEPEGSENCLIPRVLVGKFLDVEVGCTGTNNGSEKFNKLIGCFTILKKFEEVLSFLFEEFSLDLQNSRNLLTSNKLVLVFSNKYTWSEGLIQLLFSLLLVEYKS